MKKLLKEIKKRKVEVLEFQISNPADRSMELAWIEHYIEEKLKKKAEKDTTKEKLKKELLEKAKRDYPEGTIIFDHRNKKEFPVNNVKIYNVSKTKWGISGQFEECVIYYNGKWSKIIKKPLKIIDGTPL